MGLKEDSEGIIRELFGEEISKAVEGFDDPRRYPDDFIEECIYFLGQLIGEGIAKKKFMPLIERYSKNKRKINK
ncbi:MAG: hypothetical protein V1660_03590 [archaeon]